MKRCKLAKLRIAFCLILGLAVLSANQLKVQAAEVIATVQGTILSGTTSDLLLLSTKEGKMEIKLDSGTDTSECKILLPDKKISVSVSQGSDSYLHAVKITVDSQAVEATVDSSNSATVTGTLGDKTTNEILYLNTPQGEMQIKLDATTSMDGISVLVTGKTYNVTCARGSDAYMHAVTISDSAGTTTYTSPTMFSTANGNVKTMTVTGTVGDKTKESLLYLSTNEGEMQFVIDSVADTTKGMVLMSGNKLTVTFYHGSDAYLHAVGLVGVKDSASSVELDSSTSTVTGTADSSSNENILYLNTPQGKMELKMDKLNSLSNSKVIISGRKLTVTCARGSDAYMHAIDIKAE